MPRFVYTFTLILLLSSMVLARTIFLTSPEGKISLIVFFISLFLTLLTFLSLFPFALLARRANEVNYQKRLIKKTFHYSLLVSVLIVSIGILKILGALNSLNFVLLLILLVAFEFFSSR